MTEQENLELAKKVIKELISAVYKSDHYVKDEFEDHEIVVPEGLLDDNIIVLEELPKELNLENYIFYGADLGRCEGDGNYQDWVFKIIEKATKKEFYLSFEGYYSSWGSSSAARYYISEPYEYTATRYKKV